ncbi:hypothetical protein R3P38DRAFT_2495776, partial [Favolaschia claudopus]
WPSVVSKVRNDLERWSMSNPSLEGNRHIINMVIGRRTQYLARVEGMPISDGKEVRPRGEGDNVFECPRRDLASRNEAIDLVNLQTYSVHGERRATWCYFVDFILADFLEKSYLHFYPGQVKNIFLQGIHVPIPKKTKLPDQLKRMIESAGKYRLKFTALSFSADIRKEMPVWKHPLAVPSTYNSACRSKPARCLRLDHEVCSVGELCTIARRATVVPRRPHMINPSGTGRKNCGCPACQHDRVEIGCENPGKCVEIAQVVLNSIHPKWNPLLINHDMCSRRVLLSRLSTLN